MTASDLTPQPPTHRFDSGSPLAERNTWRVIGLSASMMVIEIVAGWWFGSMALLADGWHMSTHVAALGITAAAYWLARRYAHDQRFAFGTFKIEVLGGFASAILLGLVALLVAVESAERFFVPRSIQYDHALIVAVIGLLVNLLSASLLGDGTHAALHGHDHDHDSPHEPHHHHDLNLRAAYMHVLADAATSVLAIVALLGGKYGNWGWLDPLMGVVGAAMIGLWSISLIRVTSIVLLDREMDHPVASEIRETIEADGHSRISDLRVWRVGRSSFACLALIETREPRTAAEYRQQLRAHEELAHITIEVVQTA